MSQMTIEVLSSTVTTVPTAKGSYQVCELAFKNKTYDNKVEGKKIMSFAEKAAFESLKNAQMGQVFTIGRQKDDKGYWKWTEVTQGETQMATPNTFTSPSTPTAGKSSPKSTYETPEERAARQVMIVRQSSISSAVALAAANSKTKVSTEEIISMAKDFESYVLGTDIAPVASAPSAMADLIGLEDDIPQ